MFTILIFAQSSCYFSEVSDHDTFGPRLDYFHGNAQFALDSKLSDHSCQSASAFSCSSPSIRSSFSHFLDAHRVVALQLNYLMPWVPVLSALHIPVWRDLLRDHPDCLVCDFLEYGWPISYTSAALPTFDLGTHRGAFDFPAPVNSYLFNKVQLGRLQDRWHRSFPGGVCSFPFKYGRKVRFGGAAYYCWLSWPCGRSVNEGIPSDSSLGELPFNR